VNIHLESHILVFLVCLCVDLLCELDDGLELRIGFLFLKAKSWAASDQGREKRTTRVLDRHKMRALTLGVSALTGSDIVSSSMRGLGER